MLCCNYNKLKGWLLSLKPEEQKQVWIARLESYYDLDLDGNQKRILGNLIKGLRDLEKGKFYLSEAIKRDAVAMARIMPAEDFIKLFADGVTFNATPVLTKKGEICWECIQDIENYTISSYAGQGSSTDRTANCDCLWTCQQQADNLLCDGGAEPYIQSPCNDGNTTNCCNSAGGCGLFGLQTCTGHAACPGD